MTLPHSDREMITNNCTLEYSGERSERSQGTCAEYQAGVITDDLTLTGDCHVLRLLLVTFAVIV